MPTLARPDGAALHWEEAGEGALVVGAFSCVSQPAVFAELLALLAADHRVVTYDPRGTGRSSRRGPIDVATDTADLAALLEHLGGRAVLLTTGDAVHRAVRVGAARPELVRAVVTPGGNPLGRLVLEDSDSLAASDSVLAALGEMLRTDYRAALRSLLSSTNAQLAESEVRERVDEQVAYAPQDVTIARMRGWIGDVADEEARALGDRLWLLDHPFNPWFPPDVAARTRELLPDAHVLLVDDGPLSRPDITVAVVRGITTGAGLPQGIGSEPAP